jgi:hypothetical protein
LRFAAGLQGVGRAMVARPGRDSSLLAGEKRTLDDPPQCRNQPRFGVNLSRDTAHESCENF